MPTKNRRKSATIVTDHHPNLLNPNADSGTNALLKIESVIPHRTKLNTPNRFFRSYSTFSVNPLDTLPNGNNRSTNDIHGITNNSNTTITTTTVTIHKSNVNNSKNANVSIANENEKPIENDFGMYSESIATKTAFANGKNASDIQYGFWRIQRSIKEKEKFPDRINLDRRGLATLPLIVDEPNLRLLSLQHNLINSICVPASANHTTNHDQVNGLTQQQQQQQQVTNVEVTRKIDEFHTNRLVNKSNGKQNNGGRRLVRAQTIHKPLSHSLARQMSVNSNGFHRTSQQPVDPTPLPTNSISRKKSATSLTRQSTTTTTMAKNSLIPKSALLHRKEKCAGLKKSNSLINSYSKHISRLIQSRHNPNAVNANGSSFSSDSTPDIEIQPPTDMLVIKNDPFSGFAQCLQHLVFLDLYDNQIERIACLDGLCSLTVLLLGKNRITDISGIVSVKDTLRVLDLHGNRISSIAQKITQLQQLKSLNLAGNHLKQIYEDDFKGLTQLKELNIKRNRIRKINGFNDLLALERLWLCHNDIEQVNHMTCLKNVLNLREITIESNPVSLAGDCISFLVSHLRKLSLFNQMQITEQVRRAAADWRKNRDLFTSSRSDLSSDLRREEIISNARTNWELLRSQQPPKLSQCIQKSLNNRTLQMAGDRLLSGDVDVASNLSENVVIDRKMIRQKTQIIRKNLKRAVKIKRSQSTENCANPANDIRLPPIQQQIGGDVPGAASTNSSASSVGVNIDSTSTRNSDVERFDELPKITQKNDSEANDSDSKKATSSSSSNNLAVTPERRSCTSPIEIRIEPQISSNSIIKTKTVRPKTSNGNRESRAKTSNDNLETRAKTPIDQLEIRAKTPIDQLEVRARTPIENKEIRAKTPVEDAENVVLPEKPPTKATTKAFNKRSIQHAPLQRSQTARTSTAIASIASAPSATLTPKASKPLDREREQGGDYLIEICGRYLNVYGSGAIKFIDRQWNAQKANDVHTVKFSYVNFSSVSCVFGRIKNRFPNAEHFVFRETNIEFLGQLNAIAELQGLTSLHIELDGNPICAKEWRSYGIFRLSHWGIKTINHTEITKEEIDRANEEYAGLSDLLLWSLPDALIEPLLQRLHMEDSCGANGKMTAKQWLMSADSSLRMVVGKEALQYKAPASSAVANFNQIDEHRQRGRQCLNNLMNNTLDAIDKLNQLETLWPNMLLDMIKNILIDYTQIDFYLDNLLDDLFKE